MKKYRKVLKKTEYYDISIYSKKVIFFISKDGGKNVKEQINNEKNKKYCNTINGISNNDRSIYKYKEIEGRECNRTDDVSAR